MKNESTNESNVKIVLKFMLEYSENIHAMSKSLIKLIDDDDISKSKQFIENYKRQRREMAFKENLIGVCLFSFFGLFIICQHYFPETYIVCLNYIINFLSYLCNM
jgi:hypothetical protein